MKIKALVNIGGNDMHDGLPFPESEERDLGDDVAVKLVARGWAADVTPEPEPAAKETPDDNFTKMRAENNPPKTKPASK